MKVLVLAAGRSIRMKPIEDKNFIKFLGKPLIQHQLELLSENGFDEIIIAARGFNIDRLKALTSSLEMNISYAEQKDLKGMCGAVLAAKDMISDGPVLIFSSNDVLEGKALELIKEASGNGGADALILGKKIEKYFPGGYLEVDGDSILSIVEKPEPGSEPSDLINLVVHYHSDGKRLCDYLEKIESEKDDLYEVALDQMIKDGLKLRAVAYDGFWQALKYPWHIQRVFKYYFEKTEKLIASSAQISDSAVINGDVIIGENVKVFDAAIINGPAYIGDNSIIATNAFVRDSHVGENCVIGFSTEVARSFLGAEVWTHSNYIGDSVIGNNVSFGAGVVTGNLRLDEANIQVNYGDKKVDTESNKFGLITGDNVRVGINTSIMPGVKIGGGSFVGAGIVVPEDIPDNSFVRAKWELKISENRANIAKDNSREELMKKLKD